MEVQADIKICLYVNIHVYYLYIHICYTCMYIYKHTCKYMGLYVEFFKFFRVIRKQPKILIFKWEKYLNNYFAEDIQIANKNSKRGSTSLPIRKMKTTIKRHSATKPERINKNVEY